MKRYFPGLLALVIHLSFTGCIKEPADVFDQNSSQRMEVFLENAYQTLLNNKKGWMMKYYPNSDLNYGGYAIFALFQSKSEVTLTSDINSNKITSNYAVLAEGGPLLTFNGFNKVIHFFSEPGRDNGGIGPADNGMGGDFEFVIIDVTDKKITLKGKKSKNEIVMEAIPDDTNLDEIAVKYRNASSAFSQLKKFKAETPDGDIALLQNYRTLRLANEANSELMSFFVMPGALEFYKEYELGGVKFQRLTYTAPNTQYPYGYYTNESNTIKIVVGI